MQPSRDAFDKYCQKYPLCHYDYAFMKRHEHLSEGRLDDRSCEGCPECVFGDAYNDLTDKQKQHFKKNFWGKFELVQ